MRVDRLRLQGIGGFDRERQFDFPSDWTVVSGGNESGKTSLVTALYGAFFGLLLGAVPLRPEGPAWSEVVFRVGSRRFSIHRDFRAGRVRLVEVTGNKETPLLPGEEAVPEDSTALRNMLDELLGISDGVVWMQTGLVVQGTLETQLDDRVRDWLSGTPDGDHEVVHARLQAERDRLAGAQDDAPVSELEDLREEIRQRRGEAEGWEKRAAELRDRYERLIAAEQELKKATEESAELEDTLQSLVRFEDLARDRIRLEDNLQQLRGEQARVRKQVEALEAGDAQLEKDFAEFLDAPGDIEEGLHAWVESVNRRRDLERDLERAREVLYELPHTQTRRNGTIAAVVVGLVGWFACLGAGAATLGTIFLPFFAAAGYTAVWYLDRGAERNRILREQELVRLESERDEILVRERAARKSLGSLARYTEPSSLRKAYRRYLDARSSLERSRGGVDSHRPLREVMENYDATFSDLQLIDTQTRDLVAQARYLSGLDADLPALVARRESAQDRQEAVRQSREELREEISGLRAELARLESETPAPGRLAEDLARLERRERELTTGAAALEAAVDALQDSVRAYQGGHLDRVAVRASSSFAMFSRGRYAKVRFTTAVNPEVQGADGRWIDAAGLSGSALSQLYLALRLAANEEVGGDQGLPLILDEAFPAWDDERLAAAGKVLTELAEGGRQIIMLSADPRLASWGRATLSLDESAGDSATDREAA